jgi:hypothetical protein
MNKQKIGKFTIWASQHLSVSCIYYYFPFVYLLIYKPYGQPCIQCQTKVLPKNSNWTWLNLISDYPAFKSQEDE